MRDPRLDGLAEVLVGHCARVRRGNLVTIVSEPASLPAVEALFERILAAGGHPSWHPKSERLRETVLREGSEEQLTHVCPFERFRLEKCHVLIVLIQPQNTRFLGRVDPGRVARTDAARREMFATSMRRLARGESRYVLSEIPGLAAAQEAEMSLSEYEDFVFRAGFLHLADPLAAWAGLREQHERMIEFLSGKKELRFRTPAEGAREGADLRVDVSGMTWVNCAAGENFPDGEVFTGPRLDAGGGVEGVLELNFPAVHKGREVDGVRLVFKGGRVVDASATKNEEHLIALLDMDTGARAAGEIALGTNYAITRHIRNAFFDEKIGGTFHIALGAGYPQTGNANQSGLHWDLVHDLRRGGTVEADGEVIQRDGRFVREGWPGSQS